MEYRLNKIDPELRERIKETTKSGKIHAKAELSVNKDGKEKNKNSDEDFISKLEKEKNYKDKNKKKKKIIVDAVKFEEVEIPAYKEAELSKDEARGNILDVKK